MTVNAPPCRAPHAPASLPDWALNDAEWWSALHIFTSPTFANSPRVWAHIDLERRRMDGYAILNEDGWTRAERTMLAAACQLYHGDTDGHPPADVVAAVSGGLDSGNFARLVEALCIRRGAAVPPLAREVLS